MNETARSILEIIAIVGGGSLLFITGISFGRFIEKTQHDNSDREFYIVCPVCDYHMKCDKKNIRSRLEAEKPTIECGSCKASLISVYMNHPEVQDARAAYVSLIEQNKVMRAVLEEPHHPVRQTEEDALKEPQPPQLGTQQSIVVYGEIETSGT